MTLMDLARMAAGSVVNLAKKGKLHPSHIWCAMKGATIYLAAAASGDEATTEVADARVLICDLCRSANYENKPEAGAAAIYCGPALEDNLHLDKPEDRTCGCLVGVLINGRAYAGGKTSVASERCPQGKW